MKMHKNAHAKLRSYIFTRFFIAAKAREGEHQLGEIYRLLVSDVLKYMPSHCLNVILIQKFTKWMA